MFVTILTLIYLMLAGFIFVRYFKKILPKISRWKESMSFGEVKSLSSADPIPPMEGLKHPVKPGE